MATSKSVPTYKSHSKADSLMSLNPMLKSLAHLKAYTSSFIGSKATYSVNATALLSLLPCSFVSSNYLSSSSSLR